MHGPYRAYTCGIEFESERKNFIEQEKPLSIYPNMQIILYSSSVDACYRAEELGVKGIDKEHKVLKQYLEENYSLNTQ